MLSHTKDLYVDILNVDVESKLELIIDNILPLTISITDSKECTVSCVALPLIKY